MNAVTMKLQGLLASLETARVERKAVQMNSRAPSEPSTNAQPPPAEMLAMPATKPAAWDPHEVWLSRVKTPREQRTL